MSVSLVCNSLAPPPIFLPYKAFRKSNEKGRVAEDRPIKRTSGDLAKMEAVDATIFARLLVALLKASLLEAS